MAPPPASSSPVRWRNLLQNSIVLAVESEPIESDGIPEAETLCCSVYGRATVLYVYQRVMGNFPWIFYDISMECMAYSEWDLGYYLGKFYHDLTDLPSPGIMVYIWGMIPFYGCKIQVCEIL